MNFIQEGIEGGTVWRVVNKGYKKSGKKCAMIIGFRNNVDCGNNYSKIVSGLCIRPS